MIKRQGIIVYLYYNRDLRKIAKFGDVVYHSFKMRYVHLYEIGRASCRERV